MEGWRARNEGTVPPSRISLKYCSTGLGLVGGEGAEPVGFEGACAGMGGGAWGGVFWRWMLKTLFCEIFSNMLRNGGWFDGFLCSH